MNGTMATAFGGCNKEGVKNLVVAMGLDLGVDLINPSSATSEWTTVVRRNTKPVKVLKAVGGSTVTWADVARSKGGPSGHAYMNRNRHKCKDKVNSWISKPRPDMGRGNGNS